MLCQYSHHAVRKVSGRENLNKSFQFAILYAMFKIWLLMPFTCLRDTFTLFNHWIYTQNVLYFLNHVSWSPKISVCSVKISVCSGFFSVWYTFSGKFSVCSRFSRELGSPGSGFLTACIKDKRAIYNLILCANCLILQFCILY